MEETTLLAQPTVDPYPYLETLNPAQRTAVTYPPDAPLQVLAGPGSGKTKVLTARVAYLIHHFGLQPEEIVAVTFTNKAAMEMKKRLNVLLGEVAGSKLVLGTFHSTCVKYLRKYGKRIGLNNNFSIIDQEDAKKLVSGFLKPIAQDLKERHTPLKPQQVLSDISNAKAKSESPAAMRMRAQANNNQIVMVIADLYEQYEKALIELGCLDFDDLLVYGLRLLRKEPGVVSNVKHVLVDEFQDTNTTQYNLMKMFAKEGNVTIVGDPDQSIYSWRAADIENLHHMKRDYPNTEEVHLEQNYRSTGAILDASLAIVTQDKKRVKKGLYTTFGKGVPVTLKQTPNGFSEADYIADEIHRLRAQSGNMLGFDDFAILLRYNALSRVLETTLQKAQIPTRLVGGHKFFERLEVKDILAYLQLIDNPQYHPAFVRVVNVPKRGIGEKSLQAIQDRARAKGVTSMDIAERIADGHEPCDLSAPQRRNLNEFVRVIRKMRVQAKNGTSVVDLIENLLEEIGYEAYLRRTHADADTRLENVKELISYAVLVGKEQADNTTDASAPSTQKAAGDKSSFQQDSQSTSARGKKRKATGEAGEEVIDLEYEEEDETDALPIEVVDDDTDLSSTPLRSFLEASMLATDAETQDENMMTPRVTICTVHASKGLEWPVVFVPCVEKGVYPFVKSTEEAEVNEERRLLYVAMTRAQVVLEITHAEKRMLGKEEIEKDRSPFIKDADAEETKVFAPRRPTISRKVHETMASVLGRTVIPEEEVAQVAQAYVLATAGVKKSWEQPASQRSTQPGAAFYHNSHNKESRAQDYWNSERDEYALPDMPGLSQGDMSLSEPAPGFMSASQFRSQVPVAATQVPKASERMRQVQYSQPIFAGSQRAWNEAAPQPFSFGTPADMSITNAVPNSSASFQTAQSASVNDALLKNIGLPPPIGAASSTPPKPNGLATPGLNTLQSSFSSSLASLKSLGLPDVKPAAAGAATNATGPRTGPPLRRLGMGRPGQYGAGKSRM